MPPVNDAFANATVLTGTFGIIAGTLVGATGDYPATEVFFAENVWYKWTAPVDGPVSFDTFIGGSGSDTTLTVYTGTNFGNLTVVTSNDDADDVPPLAVSQYLSQVFFDATAGTDYWIEVADWSELTTFTLRWSSLPLDFTPSGKFFWKIGIYDKYGNPQGSASLDGDTNNEFLENFSDATLTYTLNGIDQLQFSLLLSDPAAASISRKKSFIKVWRFINDEENTVIRSPSWENPDFVGVVTGITKRGEEGKMTVTCQGVLWLLQVHFHIQNHRLVNDFSPVPSNNVGGNLNNKPWDHSALMWRLIDLINGAMPALGTDTGIRKPPDALYAGTGYLAGDDLFWPQTIQVSPFYVMKHAYTWPYIEADLLAREGSPDLVPDYIHRPGSLDCMYFQTDVVRGTDKTATVSFDYRTGDRNIQDIEETSQVVPGEYANYVGISGDGGPNSISQVQTDDDDIRENGIYMKSENVQGSKLSDIQQIADSKIKVSVLADAEVYSVTMSPAAPLYYDYHYTLGDLIALNADKGALQVDNVPQRIYQVSLTLSDNNVESAQVLISSDFKRKFA